MQEQQLQWTWINKRTGKRWTTGSDPLDDNQIIEAVGAEHGDVIDCITRGVRDDFILLVQNGKIIVTGNRQHNQTRGSL